MQQFAQDDPGWWLSQWQRRFGEWWEWQFRGDLRQPAMDVPDYSFFWQRLGDMVLWLAIALLLLLGCWLGWQVLRPYWREWRNRAALQRQISLPDRHRQSVSAWRQQARHHQREGNYTQACLCLYGGMLQHLDDTGIAPHLPSRTDGEYQQAIAAIAHPTPYYTLLAMHQNLKFGNAPASAALVERCLHAYAQLESS